MADAASLWVIDDDHSIRYVLAAALADAGYRVTAFAGADDALAALAAGQRPALVLADVRMPGMDGLGLLDRLKAAQPQLPVIVMSAYTDVASTAGAFRGGAREFLSKPFDLDAAVDLVARSLPAASTLPQALATSAAAPQSEPPGGGLIGEAPAMRALFRAIGRFAQVPLAVLITGETGTGKERFARRHSKIHGHPGLPIN